MFPGSQIKAYTCEVYDGRIYYFGGRDGENVIGRNTLVALDLKTLKWDLISGIPELNDDTSLPGVREFHASWILGDKMYISMGNVARQAQWLRSGCTNANEGALTDFSYDDLWSYSFQTNKWTHEKFTGNTPSKRTEVAFTFNKTWNRVLIYGGYCASLMLNDPSTVGGVTRYSYFGDTFVWNPETKRWAQVITRGFPTYRAAADLIYDEKTGRTFLFGGCKRDLDTRGYSLTDKRYQYRRYEYGIYTIQS